MSAALTEEVVGPARGERPRYPELTGLRAAAATAVVLTHAAFWTGSTGDTPLGRAFARFDVGVALFFVLSGFLLARPLFQAAATGAPRPRVAAYLWRRALRVLPAYWLTVAAALLLLPDNRGASASTWVRHLLLLPVYDGKGFAEGLSQTWSLSTEVAFYAVLPLLAAGLVRLSRGRRNGPWRPSRALAGLAALTVAGELWIAGVWSGIVGTGSYAQWLPSYLGWFGAGMALAVLTASDPAGAPVRLARTLGSSLGTCWAAAAVLFWLSCSPLGGPLGLDVPDAGTAVTKNLLYLGVALLLVLPLVFGRPGEGTTRRVLASPLVTWLGEISYGLFLVHLVVLFGLLELLGSSPLAGSLVVLGLLTWTGGVLVAALVRWAVELPAARLRAIVPERRATAGDTNPAASAATATTPST